VKKLLALCFVCAMLIVTVGCSKPATSPATGGGGSTPPATGK